MLLTINESANYLRMNHWTLRGAIRRKSGPKPAAREGRQRLYTKGELKRWDRERVKYSRG